MNQKISGKRTRSFHKRGRQSDEKQLRSQSKKSNRKISQDYSVSSISSTSSSDDSYSDSEFVTR